MRERDATMKATTEWNLLTKDWPVVQGRQQLGRELLSQRWSEGCATEAARAEGAGKTNWLNTTVASAQLLYGKKASFLLYFFTHCLFVSLLCFLCPLPRQRCRWIGAVSVRDLCVISWNAHPSKHRKLNFQLFWTILHFNSISLTLCFTSKIKTLLRGGNLFYLSLWSTWTEKQCCQLASPINKLCKLKIVQVSAWNKSLTVRIYEYFDEMLIEWQDNWIHWPLF